MSERSNQSSRILVTGAAGFIGFHFAQLALRQGLTVVGLDNLCDYYDVRLKKDRLAELRQEPKFSFHAMDLSDTEAISRLFEEERFDRVVNLAAQAGVRYSLENPRLYIKSNVVGFVNILEACRQHDVRHLVYASSSSVYGANKEMPFSVRQNVDHPVSLYAVTKKSNELMSHVYSTLYGLPTTGLRFFTVYGPWGRPDMAFFKFTKAILAGRPIDVYNHGQMKRDFTYVDDVVECMLRVMDRIPQPGAIGHDAATPHAGISNAPYRVYNIGNHEPHGLLEVIAVLEECLGKRAEKNMLPMQPGDVPETFADVEDLARDCGFRPQTPLREGVARFVAWYREYYGI